MQTAKIDDVISSMNTVNDAAPSKNPPIMMIAHVKIKSPIVSSFRFDSFR